MFNIEYNKKIELKNELQKLKKIVLKNSFFFLDFNSRLAVVSLLNKKNSFDEDMKYDIIIAKTSILKKKENKVLEKKIEIEKKSNKINEIKKSELFLKKKVFNITPLNIKKKYKKKI